LERTAAGQRDVIRGVHQVARSRPMRALLLNLARGDIFNVGLAYLASSLSARGHSIRLFTLSDFDPLLLITLLARSRAEIVLISFTNETFDLCAQVTGFLHAHSRVPVVVGGIPATVAPEECIALEGVHAVCVGEGEQAACELLQALAQGRDHTGIRNFWVKKGGRVYTNPVRPAVKDLDTLPFPDYRGFSHFLKTYFAIPVVLTRGCLFDCPYCCNGMYHAMYPGMRVRHHGVRYSIALIRQLRAQFPDKKEVFFLDDLFTWDRKWLASFLAGFRKLGLRFQCNSRFDIMDEELIGLLAASGCVQVNMAIECGNERIRKEVLKRNIPDAMIIEKAALVKKHGVRLFTHNMVGVPYETGRDIRMTVALNRRIRPDDLQAMIFTPYKGTALRSLCEKKGWIDTRFKTMSPFTHTVLKTPFIKPFLVNRYYRMFRDMVYRR
jgi:anaerobic magnesium-protoporphyrin IX monomethyl ester cyclase